MPSPLEIAVFCDNCKHAVILRRVEWPNREVSYIPVDHPADCPQLKFEMTVNNPRRLGMLIALE